MKKKQSGKNAVVPAKNQLPEATNNNARSLTGVKNHAAEMELISQLATLEWDGRKAFAEHLKRFQATAALLTEIGPRDAVESMLATQMVGIHKAAMDAIRRALHPEANHESRDMNLRHAAKLTSIYARQMETLDKHRGLGAVPITNNVRLESGAQAVVGRIEVHPPATSAAQASPAPTALPSTLEGPVLPTGRKRRAAK